MTETIDLIKNHRSVRDFTNQKLTKEEVEKLVGAAQMASTASYLQAYSIISVDDEALLKELVERGHLQDFILDAGHFFVFCGDFKRHADFADKEGLNIKPAIEGVDALMVGAIDASLAAQNMALAAESLGMGICYIGGVRDGIEEISDLLQLPDYVFPVFGLAVGYPARLNDQKPRFQSSAIHHYNSYPSDTLDETEKFEETTADYYAKRSPNKPKRTWTDTAFKTLINLPRTYMKDFLNKRKLAKH